MGLVASLSLTLDATLFSSNAGDAITPLGLLYGVTPIAATAGGGLGALTGDVRALAAAVAPVGGADIAFVSDVGSYAALRLMVGPRFDTLVLGLSAVAPGTLIAVALPALVTALHPQPRIEASRHAVVHYSDAPSDIAVLGSPVVVASPSVSMFQTDQVAVRFIMDVSWVLRAPGAVAAVTGVTW